MGEMLTSYDHESVGQGNIVDEVHSLYNDFGSGGTP